MDHGKAYTPDSPSGAMKASGRIFSLDYVRMQIQKISVLIRLALRSTRVLMVGKKTGNKAVGRTKGGLNTKLHAIVDGLGNPVAFLLSPGNDNDSTHAIELMSMTDITGSNLLGDKAYGAKEILVYIRKHGAVVVIPPKSNTKEPWPVDYCLYKERHLVECFFQKIKWFRGFLQDLINWISLSSLLSI